ncbi:MAG TPA: DUF814 domain-containing protein [Proteobacteria bacterium]|nr:DUF814 domain-containing protein [Pseudomonadota bacterium]
MDKQSLEVMSGVLLRQVQGSFITKIHQMTPWHLLLRLRGGGHVGEQRLLIAIAPQAPGLHLTQRRYLNPPRPLRFCAYLRRHLQGARILDLKKDAHDRIIFIRATTRETEKQLIIEFTGKNQNVVFTQGENMIIGALMRPVSHHERLAPGFAYRPPEPIIAGSPNNTAPVLLHEIIPNPSTASAQELLSAYDDWFFPRYQQHYGALEFRKLEKALQQHLRRLQKRQQHLTAEAAEKEKHLDNRRLGDLLKASLPRLQKGLSTAYVVDYWSEKLEETAIALNPALTPQENLEKLYKTAKKARRGLELIEDRRRLTRGDEDYTMNLLFQFSKFRPESDTSEELQELLELAAALTAKKSRSEPLAEKNKNSRVKPARPSPQPGITRLDGVAGGVIYLGRTALANDYLYRHLGRAEDFWFHVRERPGAHVLLKASPDGSAPEAEQLQAATLAAANSQIRGERRVEVTMTKIKYLRKPKGAHPGQLLLSGPHTTVTVNPETSKG